MWTLTSPFLFVRLYHPPIMVVFRTVPVVPIHGSADCFCIQELSTLVGQLEGNANLHLNYRHVFRFILSQNKLEMMFQFSIVSMRTAATSHVTGRYITAYLLLMNRSLYSESLLKSVTRAKSATAVARFLKDGKMCLLRIHVILLSYVSSELRTNCVTVVISGSTIVFHYFNPFYCN